VVQGKLNLIATGIGFGLGALLIVAAIAKATEPLDTARSIGFFFGVRVGFWFAGALILTESVLGSALLLGLFPRFTPVATAGLFLLFLAWAFLLWYSKAPVGCGCGLKFIPFLERSDPFAVGLRAGVGLLLSAVLVVLGWHCPPQKRSTVHEGLTSVA
jgi:uncharacterized membrane protein YphA (DoxX/SURF4 family)